MNGEQHQQQKQSLVNAHSTNCDEMTATQSTNTRSSSSRKKTRIAAVPVVLQVCKKIELHLLHPVKTLPAAAAVASASNGKQNHHQQQKLFGIIEENPFLPHYSQSNNNISSSKSTTSTFDQLSIASGSRASSDNLKYAREGMIDWKDHHSKLQNDVKALEQAALEAAKMQQSRAG
jgi:hypothetical protein